MYSASITKTKHYDYEVFFTNPKCEAYEFDSIFYSFSGAPLDKKPENVYCKYKDAQKNMKREDSPHYNIKRLISSRDVKELSMAYLSFSSADIIKTLCEITIKRNNTKLTLLVDRGNKKSLSKMKKLKRLMKCAPAKEYIDAGVANYPIVKFRGQVGGIGYAHNKIIIANYKKESEKVTIVFSSGNMSSGTVLHHENWHFLTTSTESYFSKIHSCIFEGMNHHSKTIRASSSLGRSKKSAINNFISFMNTCRGKIKGSEEDDIHVFAVPGDGERVMANIKKRIESARRISVAVHRFTHKGLLGALNKAAINKEQEVRFIADDDIFWAGKANATSNGDIECSPRKNPLAVISVGANMCNEYFNVQALKRRGVNIKYMQTNQSLFLLHHNKYIIFEGVDGSSSLHTGAGNFTKAAFTKNFENYYFITIPKIVKKFKDQYEYVWNNLATLEKDLPTEQVLP